MPPNSFFCDTEHSTPLSLSARLGVRPGPVNEAIASKWHKNRMKVQNKSMIEKVFSPSFSLG